MKFLIDGSIHQEYIDKLYFLRQESHIWLSNNKHKGQIKNKKKKQAITSNYKNNQILSLLSGARHRSHTIKMIMLGRKIYIKRNVSTTGEYYVSKCCSSQQVCAKFVRYLRKQRGYPVFPLIVNLGGGILSLGCTIVRHVWYKQESG